MPMPFANGPMFVPGATGGDEPGTGVPLYS